MNRKRGDLKKKRYAMELIQILTQILKFELSLNLYLIPPQMWPQGFLRADGDGLGQADRS